MNKNIQYFVIIFLLIIDYSIAQTSTQLDATQLDDSQQPIIYREYGVKPLPLEKPINPDEYILGPGDRLRVNISLGLYEQLISKEWSVENIDNFVTIGPTGKLIIPKIGPISVLGKTLGDVDREVNERMRKVYKSAEVSINLIRFRQFKVLVYGAVNKPKFVKMAPVSRLNEAINNAGGLQKYADAYLQKSSLYSRDASLMPKDIPELPVNEVLYGMMSDHDKLKELTKLVGKLRFAVERYEEKLVKEAESEVEMLASHLPSSYKIPRLLDVAKARKGSGEVLADLYLKRCFCLIGEEYVKLGEDPLPLLPFLYNPTRKFYSHY